MTGMRWWWVAPVMAVLAACEPNSRGGGAVWVTIPSGAPLEAVAESLAAHDIVKSPKTFQRFARLGRKHLDIKPGTYALRPRTPMGRVMMLLRRGTAPVNRVQVRERSTLSEVAVLIEQVMGIAAESVQVAARDPNLRALIGARAESVEGYLFPTTYYVPVDVTAEELVRQMVDTFEVRWQPEWDQQLDSLGLTRDEVVTLASIIEGEMPHDSDRPYVSSVYHNRLSRGMRLQADPTVVYALGVRRRLYRRDLEVRSDYNTYLIDGLPPGPIGQPSAASLAAALYPAASDFYFFVARRDGRHIFTRSYREHLATIRKVRGRGATAVVEELSQN